MFDVGQQDFIQFFNGGSLPADVILTLTAGQQYLLPVTSTGNKMLIYFRSYSYADVRGFLLSYTAGKFLGIKFEAD